MNGLLDRLLSAAWAEVKAGSWKGLPVVFIFTAVCLFMTKTTIPMIQSLLNGVIDLSADQVVAMQTVDNGEQIYHIVGSKTIDTGYQYTVSINSSTVESYYGVLHIGTRDLLISGPTPINERVVEYDGRFTTFVDEEIMEGVLQIFPELKTTLLPVYFSIDRRNTPADPTDSGMWMVLIAQVLMIILTDYSIWRFVSASLLKRA